MIEVNGLEIALQQRAILRLFPHEPDRDLCGQIRPLQPLSEIQRTPIRFQHGADSDTAVQHRALELSPALEWRHGYLYQPLGNYLSTSISRPSDPNTRGRSPSITM